MIPCVRIKEGVIFNMTAESVPAMAHMLSALDMVARQCGHDLTITSAADGKHSGPEDPHPHGKALDIRTHDLPDKQAVLSSLKIVLGDQHFFAFLEDPDSENQHIHAQVKKGTTYP